MQSVIEKFQNLIESKRSEILEKTRQIKEIETEIRTYEIVLDTLKDSQPLKPRVFPEQSLPALSETWQRILAFIGSKESGGASIDEIESFILASNLEVTRNTVRSQLSNYNNRGIISRVAMSQYELTNMGMLSVGAAYRTARKNQMTESMTRMDRSPSGEKSLAPQSELQNQGNRSSNQIDVLLRESQLHQYGRPVEED